MNSNNPYNNSGADNQNNTYNNTGAPNPYANNNAPDLNKNSNNNNAGVPNPYANNAPNSNNPPYNNADAQNFYQTYCAPSQYNNYNTPSMPIPPNGMPDQSWYSKEKETKKNIIIIVATVAVSIIAFLAFAGIIIGVVFGVLNSVKNSEGYDIAYSYVVNSNTFDMLNADEDDIKFTGYTSAAKVIINGDSHSSKTEYTFNVDGSELTVVCHTDEVEECYVCEECTDFN